MAIVAFSHPDGISETTYTTATIDAVGITLTVRNTAGLAANDFIVIGKPGFEQTEAVQITTVDSDTQLTIGATNFAHPIDTLVFFTPFNQIRAASATTVAGSKTQQGAAVDIEWDDLLTEFNLTSLTSGFAFARFFNSQTSAFSAYSPAIPVSGFAEDSLRNIIDLTRLRTQEETEDLVSDKDLLALAKECSDIIETIRKNWGYVQTDTEFDLTAGVQSYARPTDLAGPESIDGLFLGIDNKELKYFDHKDFRWRMRSIPKTEITAQANSGATTLTVTNTRAFGTTGSLVMDGLTTIGYTGRTIRTFTGVTGVSTTVTANAEIFRSADLDQPSAYSYWADHILFWPPPERFYNANLDYYRTIPRMTTVSDTTAVPFPHLFTWYLMSEIFQMRGRKSRSDKYLRRFERGLDLLSRKNRNKQKLKMQPAVSYIRDAIRRDNQLLAERIRGDTNG